MKKHLILVSILCLALVFSGCTNSNSNSDPDPDSTEAENTDQVNPTEDEPKDPEGTIVVEAIDGTLTGAEPSTMNFITEIASGKVAYLGSKGATANYTVESPAAGAFKLWIKTSDDGVWETGYRDATVTVNGVHVLTYKHISENTNGWKWFTLGNVSLHEGENTIAFSKANDMPASFAMLQFKLVPVIVE